MKIKNMKHIQNTLLAAGWLLAATALWSGCSEQEELMGETEGKVIAEQPGSFTFTLKGTTTPNTRATEEALSDEKEIKTLYVAFFIKNESEEEGNSKLNKIFFLDESQKTASAWGVDDGNFAKMKIGKAADSDNYTIAEPGYTGDYHVYFIANPEAAIIDKLKEYQKSTGDARTTLGTFETEVMAKGTAKDASRGFTMMSKELIAIGDGAKSYAISLTRLAARFDFVNSAPTLATITSVTFNNEATKSFVADQTTTPAENLKSGAGAVQNWPTGGAPASMTVYTYENLNVADAGGKNTNFTTITVKYALSGTNKTLKIELKEKDVPLAVLRNHLYRINLNCLTGTYEMTVTDWQGGETVTISNKELAVKYTAKDEGKIGDYVYNNDGKIAFSDGGLRKMYLDGSLEWETTKPGTVAGKGTCIGVVFSNRVSDIDYAAGYRRYVMALKNAGKNQSWRIETTSKNEQQDIVTSYADFAKDLDGLKHYNEIKELDAEFTMHPALRTVANYNVALPAKTSQWYIPSSGQWCLVYQNLGEMISIKNLETKNEKFSTYTLSSNPTSFAATIDEKIKSVGSAYYDSMGSVWYLLSSELSDGNIAASDINNNNKALLNANVTKKYTDDRQRIRPVFAAQ